MTDAPEKPLKRVELHKTSTDDFIRFLDQKAGADDLCPVCENDSWTIVSPEDDGPTFRLGTVIRNTAKPFYLSTFAYYCSACGYVRHHLSRVVYDWVAENPVPVIDDQEIIEEFDPEGLQDE